VLAGVFAVIGEGKVVNTTSAGEAKTSEMAGGIVKG